MPARRDQARECLGQATNYCLVAWRAAAFKCAPLSSWRGDVPTVVGPAKPLQPARMPAIWGMCRAPNLSEESLSDELISVGFD